MCWNIRTKTTEETISVKMNRLSKPEILIYDAGAIIMVVSLILLPTGLRNSIPYIYGVGAAMFFAMQLKSQDRGGNIVLRRLKRQQALGALVLLLASVAMWMEINQQWPLRHNEWIVAVAVGAWMELYTAFRIPKELEKEKKDNDNK